VDKLRSQIATSTSRGASPTHPSALAAGRLVEVLPEYRSLELGNYAIYPTRKHVALKVRALIDFLARQFSTSPSF